MGKLGITIFSKGMYSSWCYYQPARILFDCGEGCATYFGNFIYGIERVYITHPHGDHTLGLPSLVGCRNSARGDKEKPMEVMFPDSRPMQELIRFVRERNPNLSYQLDFRNVYPGSLNQVNDKLDIEAFRVGHDRNNLCLGYRLLELRRRLSQEFAGQNIPELLKANPDLRDKIYENYSANIFSYTLDSYDFVEKNVNNAVHWVADCTFLCDKDREGPTHMTMPHIARICREQQVKNVYLAHFSNRYSPDDIVDAVHNTDFGDTAVTYIMPGRTYEF